MFPGHPKLERGYKIRNDGAKDRHEGTKTGTRVHSPNRPLFGVSRWGPFVSLGRPNYHSPRNFYKLIPLPDFFRVIFFSNFYGNSLRPPILFCNSHALLGESRGLENIFCKFHEINSSQEFFLYCKNFGVDGKLYSLSFLSFFFWGIPCFFSLRGIPCFFERFSLLFQGF